MNKESKKTMWILIAIVLVMTFGYPLILPLIRTSSPVPVPQNPLTSTTSQPDTMPGIMPAPPMESVKSTTFGDSSISTSDIAQWTVCMNDADKTLTYKLTPDDVGAIQGSTSSMAEAYIVYVASNPANKDSWADFRGKMVKETGSRSAFDAVNTVYPGQAKDTHVLSSILITYDLIKAGVVTDNNLTVRFVQSLCKTQGEYVHLPYFRGTNPLI